MEKMNQMPSMILQSIYMEVAREHSNKSPVNSIYKDKTRSGDLQTETIFSEASSVSQVNIIYSNNETPTRADLRSYTTTIEEEDDSSDGFETLEKLTQKSDFHLQIGNQNNSSRGKSPINTPNTPELTRSPSTSLHLSPQKSKPKPAIKNTSTFKQNKLIENSSNKLFERAMSLPVQTANPVTKPKRAPAEAQNNDASPENETDDDPFGYDDSLKDFYNSNNKNKRRTAKASNKKDLKGPSRTNKEFNRSSSLSSKKSHFFYLSQSFSDNEPPVKSKFNDRTYTPRGLDNSFQEGKQRNFHTEGNESQRSPIAGSKRESFLKDLESADKHLNTPNSHNSFEENELLAKSSAIKEQPLRPSKKTLTLTIDPEAEALESLPTNSHTKSPATRISPTKEQQKSNLLLQYPPKPKTPTKSLKDSPKSPKYLKKFKVPLEANKQKESPTISPRFEKNRPQVIPDQSSSVKPTTALSKTPKSLKSVDLYGGTPKTSAPNAKVINSTKASPKAFVDPRDRCRLEGQGSIAAKEKLSIYSQKKNVPELNLNKPLSVPFNSQRSNQSNMIDSKSNKITASPILKSKNATEFYSSGTSPDKSLSKVGTESENPKDSESFIEDTKHLDRMISQASLEGITKEAYDLDPDLFEPYLNRNEAIERINTPSRIYMKIIDKILEEDDSSSTIVQESTKNTNTNTLSTPKEFYKPGHSPQSSKSRHTPVESLYATKKMSPYNARPQSPQLFDKSGGHTPKKSSDKTPKSDVGNNSPAKLPKFGGVTTKSPSHATRQISKLGSEVKTAHKYSKDNKITKKPNPSQLYSKMSKNPPRTLEILTLATEPSQGSPNYLKRDFRSNNLSPTPKSDLPDSEIPSMHSLYRQFGSLTPTNVGSSPQTLTTIGRQSPTKNLNLYNKTPTPKHSNNNAAGNRIRTEPDFEKSPKTTNTKPGFSSGRITPKGMSSIGDVKTPQKSYENKSQFGKSEKVSESLQQHLTDTLNDYQQAKKDVKIYQYRSLTSNLFNKIKGI